MDVNYETAERVCDISLSEPTEPLPNGLRFSICMPQDGLRFSAFYPIHALPMFLQACAPAQQFAKVGPMEDKDAQAVSQLTTFMNKRSLVGQLQTFSRACR